MKITKSIFFQYQALSFLIEKIYELSMCPPHILNCHSYCLKKVAITREDKNQHKRVFLFQQKQIRLILPRQEGSRFKVCK
jgi:hypothetical protein